MGERYERGVVEIVTGKRKGTQVGEWKLWTKDVGVGALGQD